MVRGIVIGLFMVLVNPVGLFAWDSVGSATEMDTHKMIAEQAVIILQNDLSGTADQALADNLQILYDNLYDLKRGAVWPDFNPDEYDLYQDHFYDPDTGLNFTNGGVPETAETQTRLYVATAIHKWKNGDYSGAAFELGTAMHFFADLNEPHHASNQTGGELTAHTEFEQWVGSVKGSYEFTSSGYSTDASYYTDTIDNYTFVTDFLASKSYECAKFAKNMVGQAQMSSSWADWEYVAENTLAKAQKSMAQLFYRFLYEVANTELPASADAIGKFHVMFKVADEWEAGTDDHVYYGMELADGRTVEYECDLPGNDFSRNLRWAYEFNITDPTFKAVDVKKVWIKKYDFTWLGDDLKLDYMQVYMKGKNVVDQNINQWLGTGGTWGSNVYYNINVDGLNYADEENDVVCREVCHEETVGCDTVTVCETVCE